MDPQPSLTLSNKAERKVGLTSEEKKIAKSLETLSMLSVRDRIFLVLIWRKFKTASPISISVDTLESTVQELKEKIEKAGLLFKDIGMNEELMQKCQRGGMGYVRYFMANNQNDLDSISEKWFGGLFTDPDVYKEIGRMSGYPQTAIDNFDKFTRLSDEEKFELKKKSTLTHEEKKALVSEKYSNTPDLYYFSTFFYMSREHAEAEMEVCRQWMEEIKLVTPNLYREFIDDCKHTT
jgi:hypothetical protein